MTVRPAYGSTRIEQVRRNRRVHGADSFDHVSIERAQEPASAPDAGPVAPIDVIHLTGTGRSGSTLLGDLLGDAPGFVHAGELRYVWRRGGQENRHCSCGAAFDECDFWRDVCADLTTSGQEPAFGKIADRLAGMTRVRKTWRLALPSRGPHQECRALDEVARLYRAVADHSGSAVIVDSSKLPTYARLLDRDPRFRVSIVHLVRDPRGVVFSWGRAKAAPDRPSGTMQQMSLPKAALLWLLWNGVTLLWWRRSSRYRRVRYEDFVAAPTSVAADLCAALGYGSPDFAYDEAGGLRLGANFGVAGNPDRFSRIATIPKLDDRWKEELAPWKQRFTTALTAPLLILFRYPIRSRP